MKLKPIIRRGDVYQLRPAPIGPDAASQPSSHDGRAAKSLYDESDRLRRQNDTLRKRLEARDLEVQVLEALLESVKDACFYVTNREIVARVNQAFLQSFGTKRHQCIGRDLMQLFGDTESDGYTKLVRRALAGETVVTERTSGIDGKQVIDHVQVKPHKTSDGGIRGCLVQISDVTVLRRREHQLAKLRPMLESRQRGGDHAGHGPAQMASLRPVMAIEADGAAMPPQSRWRRVLKALFSSN